MKNKIDIRQFVSKDADNCIKVMDCNKKDMGDLYRPESLIKASSYNKYWVAKKNKEVVGMVGLSDLNNGIGMLISLCVLPDCQGLGIGTKLIETLKKYAEKNHFRKVLLLTHAKNKKMMSLAIKEDFIPEGSLRKHFRTGEDVIYFSYFCKS